MEDKHPISTPARDHFASLVKQWSHFGPPLRPSPGDTAAVQRVIDSLASTPALRAVLLGLTPEVVGCDWPAEVDFCAVDHSPAMISALWPPSRRPLRSRAILADWCAMPFAPASVDLVVGDGCYVLLSFPAGFERLTREVHRILKPSGRFAIRLFLRPERSETVEQVGAALARGGVGSVHALKLRLLASLHGVSGTGTRLDDVWRAWKTLPAVPAGLRGRRGWTDDEVTGIEGYRGLETRYHLPTLNEARAGFSAFFTPIECVFCDHELADRCPTLIFAPREKSSP